MQSIYLIDDDDKLKKKLTELFNEENIYKTDSRGILPQYNDDVADRLQVQVYRR